MEKETLKERIRYINTHMVDLVAYYVLKHNADDEIEPPEPKEDGEYDDNESDDNSGAGGNVITIPGGTDGDGGDDPGGSVPV